MAHLNPDHRRRVARPLGPCALALGLSLAACGAGTSAPAERSEPIAGGRADATHDNVFLLVRHSESAGGLCTATLIAPNLLLTARHCVSPGDGEEVVLCGDSFLGEPFPATAFITTNAASPNDESPLFEAAAVRVPLAEVDTCGYDIALLILSANVPAHIAEPAVPRIDRDVVPGELYTAVGYGVDESGEPTGARMQRRNLSVDCEPGTCGNGVEASEFRGETGICSGDSGGPALDANGKVVGVVSRGAPGCETPVYGTVTAWQDFLIATAEEAAVRGGYEPSFWVTTGLSDPPLVSGGGEAGAGGGGGGQGEVATPGADGDGCSRADDCGEGLACYVASEGAAAQCTRTCEQTADCESGKVCERIEEQGVCVLPRAQLDESAGCAVAAGANGGASAAWLLALGSFFALKRRRK
jgi:MYXO-CTERM domain-containing protein